MEDSCSDEGQEEKTKVCSLKGAGRSGRRLGLAGRKAARIRVRA